MIPQRGKLDPPRLSAIQPVWKTSAPFVASARNVRPRSATTIVSPAFHSLRFGLLQAATDAAYGVIASFTSPLSQRGRPESSAKPFSASSAACFTTLRRQRYASKPLG